MVGRKRLVCSLAVAALAAGAMAPAASAATVTCGTTSRTADLRTIATGTGTVRTVQAGSDAADLASSTTLFVRLTFADAVPSHQVFLDTDDDRMTGMWTYQSNVSSSGWDRLVDGFGGLYRFSGTRPNVWQWAGMGATGHTRSVSGSTVDLCLPVSALGAGPRVRIGVSGSDGWVPTIFAPGAAFPPEAQTTVTRSAPGRLAVYYAAHPWWVRGCEDPVPLAFPCAIDAYSKFDHVVLGGGPERDTGWVNTTTLAFVSQLRAASPRTQVWGYVSLRRDGSGAYPVEEVVRRATLWKALGVTGIFLDEADLCDPAWSSTCPKDADGDPIAVTRERQNTAIDGAHAVGLAVFANSFSMADILLPVNGVPSSMGGGGPGRPRDMYLFENPTISGGVAKTGLDLDVSRGKFAMAAEMRARYGVGMAATDTLERAVTDDDDADPRWAEAYERSAAAGLDATGMTNHSYSGPLSLAGNLAILDPPAGAAPTPTLAPTPTPTLAPTPTPTVAPTPTPTAAPLSWRRYEQGNAAVTWTGTWSSVSHSSASGRSFRRSPTSGRQATFRFTGQAVRWIGSRAPSAGITEVRLDGVAVVRIDAYASSTAWKRILFEARNLNPGQHTLTLAVTGTKNARATSANTNVDAFDVGN